MLFLACESWNQEGGADFIYGVEIALAMQNGGCIWLWGFAAESSGFSAFECSAAWKLMLDIQIVGAGVSGNER
jgi:hypothetical protein